MLPKKLTTRHVGMLLLLFSVIGYIITLVLLNTPTKEGDFLLVPTLPLFLYIPIFALTALATWYIFKTSITYLVTILVVLSFSILPILYIVGNIRSSNQLQALSVIQTKYNIIVPPSTKSDRKSPVGSFPNITWNNVLVSKNKENLLCSVHTTEFFDQTTTQCQVVN